VRLMMAARPGMATQPETEMPPGMAAPGRTPGRSSRRPMWPSCLPRMSRTGQVRHHRLAAGRGLTARIRTARPGAVRLSQAARAGPAWVTRPREMRSPRRVSRAGGSARPRRSPGPGSLWRTSRPTWATPRRSVPERVSRYRRAAPMSQASQRGRDQDGKRPPPAPGRNSGRPPPAPGRNSGRPPRAPGRESKRPARAPGQDGRRLRARGSIRVAWGWRRRCGRYGGGGKRRAWSRNRRHRLGSRRNRHGSRAARNPRRHRRRTRRR